MSARLTIARLGAQGDGVAETERGPVFVPFALPGEEVAASIEHDRGALLCGDQAIAVAGRAGLPPFRHMRRLRHPASRCRRLPCLEAGHRGERAEEPRHRGAGRRSRALRAAHAPPRDVHRAAHRTRHAARLQQGAVGGNRGDRGMPGPVAGDRRRARPHTPTRHPDLRDAAPLPHSRHRDRLRSGHRCKRQRQAVRRGAPRRLAFCDCSGLCAPVAGW